MDIRDIARLSGYGVGTVSRVLNGHPNVSERARERVLAVVAEQGYEPNGNARYLKLQAKTSIAVMVKGASNLLFADLLERIQARLEERGEECHAVYLGEDEDEVREALSYSRTMHPKGYLFLGGDPACFKRGFSGIRVPSVLLTNSAAGFGFSNLSSFSTDDAAAAARVVDELVEAGHRRIGIIGGNREIGQVSQIRIQAAVDRLAHHGISFDFDRDYEPGHYTMDEGYQAAVRPVRRHRVWNPACRLRYGAPRAGQHFGGGVRWHRTVPVLHPATHHRSPGHRAPGRAGRRHAARLNRGPRDASGSSARAVYAVSSRKRAAAYAVF